MSSWLSLFSPSCVPVAPLSCSPMQLSSPIAYKKDLSYNWHSVISWPITIDFRSPTTGSSSWRKIFQDLTLPAPLTLLGDHTTCTPQYLLLLPCQNNASPSPQTLHGSVSLSRPFFPLKRVLCSLRKTSGGDTGAAVTMTRLWSGKVLMWFGPLWHLLLHVAPGPQVFSCSPNHRDYFYIEVLTLVSFP